MADMLLTFYCAQADGAAVVTALRAATRAPVHVRPEEVFGHDFDDAHTREQVRGSLERAAVTLVVPADDVKRMAVAVTEARRSLPVRWLASRIDVSGRIT